MNVISQISKAQHYYFPTENQKNEFIEAFKSKDITKIGKALNDGIDPNTLIPIELDELAAIDSKISNMSEDLCAKMIAIALCCMREKLDSICDDALDMPLEEVLRELEIKNTLLELPASILAVASQNVELSDLFLNHDAEIDGIEGVLDCYNISIFERHHYYTYAAREIMNLASTCAHNHKTELLDDFIVLGLIDFEELDLKKMISDHVLGGAFDLLDEIYDTENFENLIDNDPNFMVSQANRITFCIDSDEERIACFKKFEPYLPANYFTENQDAILKFVDETEGSFLNYLASKGICLSQEK